MSKLGPAFRFGGGRRVRGTAPPQAYVAAAFLLFFAAVALAVALALT